MTCSDCHRQGGRHSYGCPHFQLTDEADVAELLISREEEERQARTEESYIEAFKKEMTLPGAWLSTGERWCFTWRGNRASFGIERFDTKRERDRWITQVVRDVTRELQQMPCRHAGWEYRYAGEPAQVSLIAYESTPQSTYVSRVRCCLDCGSTL